MRILLVALVAAATLAACRRAEPRPSRDPGEAQIVALGVRTDPAGARVRVNQIARLWTTPCDIADFSIRRGTLDVEVTLEGYEPCKVRVPYDGRQPASLRLSLVRMGAAAAAPMPVAPPAAPPVAPAASVAVVAAVAPQAAPPAAGPKPEPPVRMEAAPGGTRIRATSPNTKLRIHARTVVSDPDHPGEVLLPNVPPEKVEVEFLDSKSDQVLGSVEFIPASAPAVVKPPAADPAVAKPPVAEADRVGEVKMVSKTYGVFVRLDPGLSLQPGEEILIFREGREVARTKILKITKADPHYPDGAAEVGKDGSIQKGDEARRSKP